MVRARGAHRSAKRGGGLSSSLAPELRSQARLLTLANGTVSYGWQARRRLSTVARSANVDLSQQLRFVPPDAADRSPPRPQHMHRIRSAGLQLCAAIIETRTVSRVA